jgi:glycosyltransferase involved in cell wall biosynthesis
MKVLLFTNLYPSPQEPGRGTFNRQRFQALLPYCEARVISPLPWWTRRSNPRLWFHPPSDDSFGIEAIYPTYWSIPSVSRFHARGMAFSLRSRLQKLRTDFPFDIILAAWAYPDATAAARLAESFHCPLVTMVQGSDINETSRCASLRPQVRWALNRSQRIVAVSRALRDGVIELGIPSEKIVVQHNGVNGERFAIRDRGEARARLGLPPDRLTVCYVGNLKSEKGISDLIEAMGHLDQSGFRDADLVVVGDGPLAEPLRARVNSLGLSERVKFVGCRPHEEIPDWISACNALCLPSHREGCPNVVLEALAAGRPVVATAVGGVPELLHEGNGVIVPPHDPRRLAEGLKAALIRPWNPQDLRDSVQFLSWDQFGLTLNDVLAAALKEGASR